MGKKIIVKVAAGLGNQMFMYANAFSLAKRFGYKLFIDNTSGFFQAKNRTFGRAFGLNSFKEIIDINSTCVTLKPFLR